MRNRNLFLLIILLSPLTSFAAEEVEDFEAFDVEAFLSSTTESDNSLIAATDNLGPTAAGFAADVDFGPEDENFVDPRVLRDFIESRGLIECRQKEGKLTIAADVRARWIAAAEKVRGDRVRGFGTDTAINLYKSEVNLFLDYVAPRSWVSTKVKWAAFDGVDGGSLTKTAIDRAFIGFDVYHQGEEDFYIEIGRSKLDYMFESRVEYTAFFDGIHFYYTNTWPGFGVFTIHGGPFIVDSFTNHYAWIVEVGVTKWRGTGWGFRYSIVDWNRDAPTVYYGQLDPSGFTDRFKLFRNNPRYDFLISQMLIGYERKINFLKCKTLYIYGAALVNHDAKRRFSTDWKKLNGAWYAGFTLGKLCKACDWSVDINYQSVQTQAIPEFDLAGIGHGNATDTLFSDAIILGLPPSLARGFTNYKGWQFNLLYALTDSLSIRSKAEWTTPRNKSVGSSFFYKSFEMSVIYAF